MNHTLAARLSERIRREGPITFHDWMRTALYDERHGYYCRNDLVRWGRKGDYRTSPETSTLFASTFARYFAQLFLELGSPTIFTIFEPGGGAGQFAAQVLETLQRRFPPVFESVNYVLDEISPDARRRARHQLAGFQNKVEFKHLMDVNIDRGIIFSNELIDAFPVHRVGFREGTLFEFYVGVGPSDNFAWVEGSISSRRLVDYLKRFRLQPGEGQILEINLGLEDWYHELAERIEHGFVITVDYGAEADEFCNSPTRKQGTLRAIHRHRLAENILSCPGEQDITSTIDWTAMKEIGRELGFELVAFEQQDRFLLHRGLLEELEVMVTGVESEAEKVRLRTSVREMVLPGGLADNFQVLVQRKGF